MRVKWGQHGRVLPRAAVELAPALQVRPKGSVLNRNAALSTEFTENSCNSAFPYKAPPAVREWIYRDIHIQPACGFLSGQKFRFCPVD